MSFHQKENAMGRYSEALRKIEEERQKKDPSLFVGEGNFRKVKPYLITLGIIFFVIILSIYGYGIREGMRLRSPSNNQLTTFKEPKQEIALSVTSPQPDNAVLLNTVEQMVGLTYSKASPEPESLQMLQTFRTIQVASFKDHEAARSVAKDLSDQGHEAFVVLSGKYFSVCIGKFKEKAEAQTRFAELRTFLLEHGYQDAFVRYVKRKEPSE